MIHESITSRGAGFVRAWIFSIWIVYLIPNKPHQLAELPRDQFSAPGVLKLLPSGVYDVVLTTAGLHAVKWVLMAGLIACAVGVRPWRAIAIPTVLLLTLHQGLVRGFFYVNHKELTAIYATYVLAAFPATGFSPFAAAATSRPTERQRDTTRLMMLLLVAVLVIPYCLIGARRLAQNDMSLWNSDILPYYMARHNYGSTWYGLAPAAEAVLTQPWLIKAVKFGFPVVTVFEVLSPLCFVNARFRRVWLVVMTGFHLSTLALMDILFWESLLLFPVLLVDGEVLLRRFDRLRDRHRDRDLDRVASPDPVTV